MTGEELLNAVGQVNERYLIQSEETVAPRSRRTAWRLILVAAIVAVLTVTAVAATGGFGVWGGSTELVSDGEEAMKKDDSIVYAESGYQIRLDLEVSKKAPRSMEKCYVPQDVQIQGEYTFRYVNVFWDSYDAVWSGEVDYDNFNDSEWVYFSQIAAGNPTSRTDHISAPNHAPLEKKTVIINNMSMFEVSMDTFRDGRCTATGFRRLYWTDGEYVFTLEVPYDFSDEKVGKIIASMAEVEMPERTDMLGVDLG